MIRFLLALAALGTSVPAIAQQRSVVNVSGLEYSSDPAATPYHGYVPPSDATLASIKDQHFWGIRLPINEELLQADPAKAAAGVLNESYVAVIIDAISRAQKAGLAVIVDLHNFGRFWGNPINQVSSDPALNIRPMYLGVVGALAGRLQAANAWGFAITNEPHDIAITEVQSVEQDAVNVARAAGFRNVIFVDDAGWATSADGIQITVQDSGPVCYDVHAYGDGNGSGTYQVPYALDIDVATDQPVNADTIVDRLRPSVEQAARERRCLFIGEIGAPLADPDRRQQVLRAAEYLRSAHVDWAYWTAGEWTGNDPNSLQASLISNAANGRSNDGKSNGGQSFLAALPGNR